MHIGIITHNYPSQKNKREDAGTFIYDFAHELSKRADVFVYSLNSQNKGMVDKKVPVTYSLFHSKKKFGNWSLFSPSTFYYLFKLLQEKNAILSFVKDNNIDFCLAAWALPSGIFAEYIKKNLGIPYGIWCLGSDLNRYTKYPFLSSYIKKSLINADLVFANSYSLQKKVEVISNSKSWFLPSVTEFDLKGISPIKMPKAKYKFLFVGRLENVKGPDILIEACYCLKKNRSDFVLNIVGSGSLSNELKQMVKKRRLFENIRFWGSLDKKGVAGFMLTSDFLIIPSRSESLPLVITESARCRLPIISNDVGDCLDIIKKYKIGIAQKFHNAQSLAEVLEEVMDPKKIKSIKNNAKFEKLVKIFNQKYSINLLMNLLKRL